MEPVAPSPRGWKPLALVVALAYVAGASLYIWVSDRLAVGLAGRNLELLTWLSTTKGWLFVLATGAGLYALVWRLGEAGRRTAEAGAAQRQQAKRLAEANEQLRLLVEGSPHYFFYVQDLEGHTTYVSPTVEAITGHPVEEWIGESRWFVTGSPLNQAAREATHRHLRGEFDGAPIVVEVRHADGHAVLLEAYEYGRYAGGRLEGLQGIAHDVTERVRSQRLQDAVYQISEAANTAASLPDLFAAVHAVIGELMPAKNFYVALHDPESERLSFPYFVDEVDPEPEPRPLGRGLTDYVLRTGVPYLSSRENFAELVHSGEVVLVGSPAVDWLGVPLTIYDHTLGVLVVQSYTEGVRFGEQEKSILQFVSSQVAQALERTRAEEALRASEQKLRDIVEHSTNLFYSYGPDGVLTYVSPQARAFFDCEPDEALVHWGEFATGNPANAAGLKAVRNAIDTGKRQAPYEMELVGRKGRRIWVEVNEAPLVRDGRTVAVVGALTDVTERRRAEEALQRSQEQLRDLFDNALVGFYRTAPNGRVLMANPALVRMLGYSSFGEMAAHNLELESPYRGYSRAEFKRRLEEDGVIVGLEALWAKRDGSHVHARESARAVRGPDGAVVYYEGTVEDITDRKQAERALQESEERYRRLVEASPDGIIVHRHGRCLFANTTAARLLGLDSPSALVGREILHFVHPDFREQVRERVRQIEALGTTVPVAEEKLVRADGTTIDAEIVGIPFSFGGEPAVQVVMRDVTSRKRLEEHLRQAQKMEAIGGLAGGVAHDFNNLLQALLSTVQVLKASNADPDRLALTVAELEANIRRGGSLTRQLLLFSRREVTRPQPLDLNEVVQDASELLQRLVRENIRISLELAPRSPIVLADHGQIEQVLVNLVMNASDAMPDGGALAIRTGDNGHGEAWFAVEDTGIGVAEEIRERIFEPFFTTKAPGKGTGLGLSVVHGIVAEHHGRIELSSRAAEGSSFRVTLPGHGSIVGARRAGEELEREATRGNGERVLLVEDETGAREGLREVLALLGYVVTAVGTGEAAAELPLESAFDVLVTDLVLPGMPGSELARLLGRRWPALEVIVMSGYTEDEAIRRGVSQGQVRFLQKPFDMATLAQELRAALDAKQR